MSDDQYVCFGKILYAEPVVGLAALGVIKLSIVCFYKRIFTTRAFGITCNAFLALIICWTIGALVGQIFQLWPIYDNWSIEVSNADAPLNYPAFLMAIAVFDLAIDVAILCLPVRPTIKLQMSKKRKYSILGIFALGSLCCVAEAVRIYQQWEFLYAPSVADNPVVTDTGSLIQIVNWLTIEACLSTVAASLPTIGGLFVKSNSTESFVNRFRSFFSLPSRSILISERDSKRSKVSGEARTDDATRREWHELHLNSANKMAVEEERKF
ncbi:hypothetical protein MMC10_004106 [Thelotrema lepadinum]|nr:hypothetical protein [Thelotrema lepadinum]